MTYGGSVLTQTLGSPVMMWSQESLGPELRDIDAGWAGIAYTANLVCYWPFYLVEPVTLTKLWWYNGSPVAGNVDCGIYDASGTTKIIAAGATAMSGASALQVVDVTDTLLGAGRYWCAFGSDSATAQFNRMNLVAQWLDAIGCKQQASGYSSGLPSSATFAVPSVGIMPVYGFATRVAI
jgi:hypothetical protein